MFKTVVFNPKELFAGKSSVTIKEWLQALVEQINTQIDDPSFTVRYEEGYDVTNKLKGCIVLPKPLKNGEPFGEYEPVLTTMALPTATTTSRDSSLKVGGIKTEDGKKIVVTANDGSADGLIAIESENYSRNPYDKPINVINCVKYLFSINTDYYNRDGIYAFGICGVDTIGDTLNANNAVLNNIVTVTKDIGSDTYYSAFICKYYYDTKEQKMFLLKSDSRRWTVYRTANYMNIQEEYEQYVFIRDLKISQYYFGDCFKTIPCYTNSFLSQASSKTWKAGEKGVRKNIITIDGKGYDIFLLAERSPSILIETI